MIAEPVELDSLAEPDLVEVFAEPVELDGLGEPDLIKIPELPAATSNRTRQSRDRSPKRKSAPVPQVVFAVRFPALFPKSTEPRRARPPMRWSSASGWFPPAAVTGTQCCTASPVTRRLSPPCAE